MLLRLARQPHEKFMSKEPTLTPNTTFSAPIEHYGKLIVLVGGAVFAAVVGWQQFFESKDVKTAEKFVKIDQKFVDVDKNIAALEAGRSQQAMIDQNLMSSINDLKAALNEQDKKNEERNKETNALLNKILMNSRGIK